MNQRSLERDPLPHPAREAGDHFIAAIGFNSSAYGTVLIKNNLLAGGAYTLYCPKGGIPGFQVIDNRFSTLFYPKVGAYGPATDCAGETTSGNVYHETGLPLSLG